MAKNKKEKPVVINASFEQLVKESVAGNAVSKKDVTAKKITAKQHGNALLKLMQVTSNETNKYLAICNDDNVSQKKKTAIGQKSLKAIREQTDIFDAIDKAYKDQNNE